MPRLLLYHPFFKKEHLDFFLNLFMFCDFHCYFLFFFLSLSSFHPFRPSSKFEQEVIIIQNNFFAMIANKGNYFHDNKYQKHYNSTFVTFLQCPSLNLNSFFPFSLSCFEYKTSYEHVLQNIFTSLSCYYLKIGNY